MPKYNVWQSYMEQWDKDDIDPPDLVVEARDPSAAAIEFATKRHVSPGDAAMIVQEVDTTKYFEIELENVLIGAIMPKVEEGSIIQEQVGLKFSKIKWKYTQQKVSGGAGGNTSGGWDLATNKVA